MNRIEKDRRLYYGSNKRTIRINAVFVDALLRQGEALDCYNMKLQNEATITANLENNKIQQAIEIINSIEDPIQKATLYKKVYGDCCDVPQSCCCNNCNTSTDTTS